MARVVLRRSNESAATADDARRIVASHAGNVINQSGTTMLVELAGHAIPEVRGKLPGWIVAEQGPQIPVPDARLKVRQPR
jgi:anti-sigma factor ChrR (cupin superfamily)